MRIGIGADHGGFSLKVHLKAILVSQGHDVVDFGTDSEASVDYPDIIADVARAVAMGEADRGVVLCGSGQGAAMVANKISGIRCALCTDPYVARLSRQHNDANMLAMGGRIIGIDMAMEILNIWMSTPFEGGRHSRRINQIEEVTGPSDQVRSVEP